MGFQARRNKAGLRRAATRAGCHLTAPGATGGLPASAWVNARTTLLDKPAVPPAAAPRRTAVRRPSGKRGRRDSIRCTKLYCQRTSRRVCLLWQKRIGGRKPLPTAVLSGRRAEPHSAPLSSARPNCLDTSGNHRRQASATEPREGNTGDAVTHVDSNLRSTRGTPRPPGNGPKDGAALSPPVYSRQSARRVPGSGPIFGKTTFFSRHSSAENLDLPHRGVWSNFR